MLNSNSILNPILVTTCLLYYYLLVPLFDTILSQPLRRPEDVVTPGYAILLSPSKGILLILL